MEKDVCVKCGGRLYYDAQLEMTYCPECDKRKMAVINRVHEYLKENRIYVGVFRTFVKVAKLPFRLKFSELYQYLVQEGPKIKVYSAKSETGYVEIPKFLVAKFSFKRKGKMKFSSRKLFGRVFRNIIVVDRDHLHHAMLELASMLPKIESRQHRQALTVALRKIGFLDYDIEVLYLYTRGPKYYKKYKLISVTPYPAKK